MDSVNEIDVYVISRRIFYLYYPIWIIISLLISLIVLLQWGLIGFIASFIGCIILAVIIYAFAIIIIDIFKPKESYARLLTMIIVSLVFTWPYIFVYTLLISLNHSLSRPFLLSELIIFTFLIYLSLGAIIYFIFFIEEKQYIAEIRTIEERNKRTYNEKKLTETHLRLLQAQIEPHFLFNTLTSVLTLGKKDPNRAKIMQQNFMQYLKTTLSKTRVNITTISHEIELIRAYLDIYKVRMGKRLLYSIQVDDEVKKSPFPSMLIQPIVENAIKHGLEPKINGGEININVKAVEDNRIRWEIKDTGLGMSDKANKGTGLSNIIERMKSLYDNEGHLTIMDNKPSGVKVTLEVPDA